jgi:hypothetical protein
MQRPRGGAASVVARRPVQATAAAAGALACLPLMPAKRPKLCPRCDPRAGSVPDYSNEIAAFCTV